MCVPPLPYSAQLSSLSDSPELRAEGLGELRQPGSPSPSLCLGLPPPSVMGLGGGSSILNLPRFGKRVGWETRVLYGAVGSLGDAVGAGSSPPPLLQPLPPSTASPHPWVS